MSQKPKCLSEDWCTPASYLIRVAGTLLPSLIPVIEADGRSLPDVDLDILAETILGTLADQAADRET